MKRVLPSSLMTLIALASCGDRPAPPPVIATSLGGEVVVRVGNVGIPTSLVARVAGAQGITPREAALFLGDDALAAAGALDDGLDRDPSVRWQLVSARARLTINHIREQALAAGAPNDDELAELTANHWREFDLPDQIRVVHAVVLRPEKKDPVAEARAKAVAAEVQRAVLSATDEEDFIARANAVPAEGAKVVAQKLPPFVADGRSTVPGGDLDGKFAAGAFTLTTVGTTSQIVETSFGWHVIRLVEKMPGRHVPAAERRVAFQEETYAMRGHKELVAKLAVLRQSSPVEISTAAETLMGAVSQEIAAPPPVTEAP